MKRPIALIIFIVTALFFASCDIKMYLQPGDTPPPAVSSGALTPPVFSPPAAHTDSPGHVTPPVVYTGSPIVTPVPKPVIITARGYVLGGYNSGEWIGHSAAGSLVSTPMKFYAYNLAGFVEMEESSGVTAGSESTSAWSYTIDSALNDESAPYRIILPGDSHAFGEYASNPLSCTFLTTVVPDYLPRITVITDTSALLPIIQRMVDAGLGAGTVTAQINTAVSIDIDRDGAEEYIVNANNCAGRIGDESAVNLYSIACIIEGDGTVCTINDAYSLDYEAASTFYVLGVIDFEGDGEYEIVLEMELSDVWGVGIYKFNGEDFIPMIDYHMPAHGKK